MGDGIISLPEVDKGKFAGNHHFFQVIVVSAKIPAAQWSQLFFWQPKCWGRTRQTSVGWKQRSKLDCYLLQLLISQLCGKWWGQELPNLEVWYPNILPVKPMRMLKQTITYPNAWLKGLIGLRQVHVPGNLVPSEDAYQSAIRGQRILEDGASRCIAGHSWFLGRSSVELFRLVKYYHSARSMHINPHEHTAFARKELQESCRWHPRKSGCEAAFTGEKWKKAHTAAAYQSQRDKEQATWHHSGK